MGIHRYILTREQSQLYERILTGTTTATEPSGVDVQSAYQLAKQLVPCYSSWFGMLQKRAKLAGTGRQRFIDGDTQALAGRQVWL